MKDSVFKKYDIRGRVPEELSLSGVYDLGRALGVYAVELYPPVKQVVVGMDGRIHSPVIKEELVKALTDSGFDVIFLGVCPTPIVYFALHTWNVPMGIMITASHNGGEYNGMKIVINNQTVWGAGIQRIKTLYEEKARIQAACKGMVQEQSIHERYYEFMLQQFSHLIGMSLPVIIDCGNGAAGTVIPDLIERFEWKQVKALFAEVDGVFPAHPADPVKPENMYAVYEYLQDTDAQCGIGFDGDGDRMAAMTKSGRLIPGDILLALFSEPLVTQHPGARIVFDAKCSSVLPSLLTEWGAQPIMSPSGHAIIKTEIQKSGALLGGELSCHFFFNDRYFGFDDGIYAALRLIELLLLSRKTLEELISCWPHNFTTPELRIICEYDMREEVLRSITDYFLNRTDTAIHNFDGIRIMFPYGSALIRLSNTEPVLCVRWESQTQEGFELISQEMEHVLITHCPHYMPGKYLSYNYKQHHQAR